MGITNLMTNQDYDPLMNQKTKISKMDRGSSESEEEDESPNMTKYNQQRSNAFPMLIANNNDSFQVLSKKKTDRTMKKRASSTKKRHLPLIVKMDYSLSNSSADDENQQIEEVKLNQRISIDDFDPNGSSHKSSSDEESNSFLNELQPVLEDQEEDEDQFFMVQRQPKRDRR